MPLYTLRYDPTGSSQLNKIVGEEHTITTLSGPIIVAEYGLVYAHSIEVMDVLTNQPLFPNVDYVPVGLDPEVTKLSSLACVSGLQILTPNWTGTIRINYQAVGGKEGGLSSFLTDIKNRLIALSGSINWGALSDRIDGLLYEMNNQYLAVLSAIKSSKEVAYVTEPIVCGHNSDIMYYDAIDPVPSFVTDDEGDLITVTFLSE